jgi:hypothetical protein
MVAVVSGGSIAGRLGNYSQDNIVRDALPPRILRSVQAFAGKDCQHVWD